MYDFLNNIPENLLNLIYLFILIFIIVLTRNLTVEYLKKRIPEKRQIQIYKIYLNYITLFIILFFIIPPFLPSLKEFVTVLSIFGAGILLVFKEIIQNFYGFFYITLRKPFKIGDRIKINNIFGDILDIRLLDFSMLQLYPEHLGGQSSGRVINIPNSYIFLYPISNFSKEFAFNWFEIKIPLTTNSDWKKAEDHILKIIYNILNPPSENDERLQISQMEYAIKYSKITPRLFLNYEKGCILLSLRFLCEPRQQRQVKDQFWREFLNIYKKQKSYFLNEHYDVNYDF